MNRLFVLLSVTLLALWYANFTSVEERNKPIITTSRDQAHLAPHLLDKNNKVRRIEVSKEGADTIILELDQKDDTWKVKTHNHYPAKKSLINKLINDMTESVLLEEKTSNPELWTSMRLDQKQATRVKMIGDEPNSPILDLYIGQFKAPLGGTYVRYARDKQAWLATGEFTPEMRDEYWLSQELFSVDQRRLKKIIASHISADGLVQNITLEKETPFLEFALKDIPAWSDAQNYYNAMMIPAGFEDLVLTDVSPYRSIEGSKDPYLTVMAETFDGLVLTIHFIGDDNQWAVISAVYDAAKRWIPPASYVDNKREKPLPIKGYDSDVDKDSRGYDALDGMDEYFMLPEKTVASEAKKLNDRTHKWAYVFPAYKYSMFARSPASIFGENPSLATKAEEEIDPANTIKPIQPPKFDDAMGMNVLKTYGIKDLPKIDVQKALKEQQELMKLFEYEPLVDKKLFEKPEKEKTDNTGKK